MKKCPNIIIHHVKNCDGPPFLKLKHMRIKLQYPNGNFSKEFTHDIVERKCKDAVVICPYEIINNKNHPINKVKIYLRSCVRPSIATRYSFPNSSGNIWELPAGLIEDNETPIQSAIRELSEEVGFESNESDFIVLGNPVFGSIGLSNELLYFVAVNVTNKVLHKPSEDGSELEKFGECISVTMKEALESMDLKTKFGIYKLNEYFNKIGVE